MKNFSLINTPIGTVKIIAENGFITDIFLTVFDEKEFENQKPNKLTISAAKQLLEYFDGMRKEFDLPLNSGKKGFAKKVSEAMLEIPYGKTATYKQIAEKCSNPKASRAVGAAAGSNRIMIVIPCHRVVGSNGKLTGYAYGIEVKKYLLDLEKRFSESLGTTL